MLFLSPLFIAQRCEVGPTLNNSGNSRKISSIRLNEECLSCREGNFHFLLIIGIEPVAHDLMHTYALLINKPTQLIDDFGKKDWRRMRLNRYSNAASRVVAMGSLAG